MNKLILIFFFQMLFLSLNNSMYGQAVCSYDPACMYSPFNGTLNLANPPLLFSVDSIFDVSYRKPGLVLPYNDVEYADDNQSFDFEEGASICLRPENDQCVFDSASFFYDIYYPSDYPRYSQCPLPAVVLWHAGGFSDCSKSRVAEIMTVCRELAKRGFVCFNVEYRRGRILDERRNTVNLRPYRTLQHQRAAWVACQDARGALRSIIQRAREGFGSEDFVIDTNNIFVGGFSAGAVMAINAAWYNDAMMDQVFPVAAGSSTFSQALGSMNVNMYYGNPGVEFKTKIRGLASMWGGFAIPLEYNLDEYNFFPASTLTPAIAFHGFNDKVFPYSDDNLDSSDQKIFFSPSNQGTVEYNNSQFCGVPNTYLKLDTIPTTYDLITGSAENIHKILEHYGIANELNTDCTMGHGLDKCGPGCFDSDFGTLFTTARQVDTYIAQRIATFFQAVLSGIGNLTGRRVFFECENKRVGCQQNVNPSCPENCDNF